MLHGGPLQPLMGRVKCASRSLCYTTPPSTTTYNKTKFDTRPQWCFAGRQQFSPQLPAASLRSICPNHSCQYWKPRSLMLSPLSLSVSCSSVNVTATVIRTRVNYMRFLKLRRGLSTEQARGDNSSINKLWHILTPMHPKATSLRFFSHIQFSWTF